jgi:hypothetical protein
VIPIPFAAQQQSPIILNYKLNGFFFATMFTDLKHREPEK